MLSNLLLVALAAAPLVSAHGKIAAVKGDAGGNGTGIGIMGGVVPGAGKNSQTEVDTTVFRSTKAATDGLGKTTGNGPNTLDMMADAMAQSGSTLPQVSNGGSLTGTVHIVTTDGAGPYEAIVDPTGTGAFSEGNQATITTQVPGAAGNIRPDGTVPGQARRWLESMAKRAGLMKRAANVNKNYPIAIQMPAGTTCTGTVGGQANTCLVKIANSNPAGPFGGVVAVQMAGASAASGGNATTAGQSDRATGKKATEFNA